MQYRTLSLAIRTGLVAASLACMAVSAGADVITDWNIKAGEIVAEAKLGAPPSYRVMAIVHTSVYEATNAITRRYPASRLQPKPAQGASVDAAVAAANRDALAALIPSQQPSIDAAYQAALAMIPDSPAKTAGIATGQSAASAVLAWRADDGATALGTYRPHTTAGVYVPTVLPVTPQWPQRKPWLMTSAAQFRPSAPPALTSSLWARDYNEIKMLGGKSSTRRSAEQTEIARFWEFTLPSIYHGIVRSVANMPRRDVTQNARLFAAVTQAGDDALIAVFESKYHYSFWRPVTAIRNGDIDGNDATEQDLSWAPLIDTPMHPEYPCGHCILAGTIGPLLKAEIGAGPMPILSTTSPTAKGASRRWTNIDDFVQEVSSARIYGGVHYRVTTEIGTAMGKQIGELAVAKVLRPPKEWSDRYSY